MTPDRLEILLDGLAVLVTALIILRAIPLVQKKRNPMTVILFLFAMTSLLLAYTYWLTYTVMRPDTRMPIAANEIGEIAVFLLLAAMLETVFRESAVSAKREILFSVFFCIASIALWIGWSGEWVQDIIGGIAYGYFFCVCARSLKQAGALKKPEWIALAVSLTVLVIGEAVIFFIPETWSKPLDLFCYAVMFAVLAGLLLKNFIQIRNGKDAKVLLALSCSAYAFALSSMYMSAGWFYPAAMICSLLSLPLMAYALRKEVTA